MDSELSIPFDLPMPKELILNIAVLTILNQLLV